MFYNYTTSNNIFPWEGNGNYTFKGHALNGNIWWNTASSEDCYINDKHTTQIIFVYENKRL